MRVGELLSRYPSDIQGVARELRNLIVATMPGTEEAIKAGWGAVTFRHPDAGYVCGIFPFRDHIKLVFEKGVMLEDLNHLFAEKSKKLKQVRYIEVASHNDIAKMRRALVELIKEALELGLVEKHK
jgi:hypothetical protein